ncbi:HEAT repeat domain containing protein [Histomonas meleagridis]|uniref:HEAT repeat domain containing protein n=1 Tax=Histomonas meleagridis TaxID=135588 RepID=UPI00355A45CB|nr:HEAT repeat domain containing protein [Histomonas meleagridis]KAH0796321.1 HEAT repeat domain containing protein [Histomonas meleagridis]
MNEHTVSKYLVENNYSLTALEFMCENYERTGTTIDELSQFFEDSANFLMFEDMKSVSEISSNTSEPIASSNDAIRIKDDRIAVLEHDIRVLRDSLEEAKAQLKKQETAPIETVQSSTTNLEAPAENDEDLIITILIRRYLQSKGYKLSAIAFNNETSDFNQTKKVNISEDVDLVQLLRSFRLLENSPQMADEIKSLRNDKIKMKNTIMQLTQDINHIKQQNAELTNLVNSYETNKPQEKDKEPSVAPVVQIQQAPPEVELLDSIFSDMMQLANVIEPSERKRVIKPLETIIKFHPNKETRIQCLSLLFSLWDEPDEEQRNAIVNAMLESCTDPERIESEVLSAVSLLLGQTNPNVLCLVSSIVASIAPLCTIQLRCSFLLSILKQLSEHSNPLVRSSAAIDGSKLVLAFQNESEANDKFPDLLDLTKLFAFDQDASVHSAALNYFIPAVVKFTQLRCNIGHGFCDFWIKHAFTFGLTGSSMLATIRFKTCAIILETAMKAIVPNPPKEDQQLIPEGTTTTNDSIIIPKSEYEWITNTLVPQLPKFSPMLYVQINIRKEVDRIVAQCCKILGQQFVSEFIVPEFLTVIDKTEGETKGQHVTLFLSAVSPSCDRETFYTHSRNFLTYATNELRGFKSRDIQDFIAPSFNLFSSREPEKRLMIFKLIEELSKSSRVAIRNCAVTVISEILPTLEQSEITKNILPIILKLSTDEDETLQLEVINCTGVMTRFASDINVLKSIRELFNNWFEKSNNLKLQCLRVFNVIVNDVDIDFQLGYVIPKVSEIANSATSWSEQGEKEQAMMLILHTLYNVSDIPDQVVKDYVAPTLEIVQKCEMTENDPKLKQLLEKYNLVEQKTENAFTKMFGQK